MGFEVFMEKINVWDRFSIFYSASFSQKFLQHCYKNHHESDKLSYQNCYPFIYYLDHGKKYYEQASISPVELQPVLLFYGLVQLMKALLLTVDPLYPRTTQVLAHGVTTRKRKKNQYEFLMDEVKVQKNGLFTYFAERLFQLGQMEGEKIIMEDLLKGIPEL